MPWMNNDGLYVKFGKEEGARGRGGELPSELGHTLEFKISYLDLLTATPTILGAAAVPAGSAVGTFGVVLPKGARVTTVDTFVDTAFTSSGTIGSATLVMGTKLASDRSTEQDHDGLTTTAFVGSNLDAASERVVIAVGSTGVGAFITGGTPLAANGVIVVSNSAHATHPYTAGLLTVRVNYKFA